MQQSNNALISLWPIRLLLILWGGFVALDYLFHHPYYVKALIEFRYWPLLFLLIFALGFAWFFLFRLSAEKQKKPGLKINGLSLYFLVLSLMLLVYGYYAVVNNLFSGSPVGHLAYFVAHTIMLHSFVFILLFMATVIGASVINSLKAYYSAASFYFIAMALGLSLMGIAAVVLGLFNLLYSWLLWLMLLGLAALRYKFILPFLKDLALKPVSIRMGWQGLLTTAVLFVFIAINALAAIKNFPVGFDGANLYLNTSKLIGEYRGLPAGGQAFNWSVIMSFGDLLFRKTAVSILLAHLSGILCLVAIYRIGRLFMAPENSLLGATIFYTAPYITFHNIVDEKVDLGFLFISLSTLLLLLEFHFRRTKNERPKLDKKILIGKKWTLSAGVFVWILAGWLTGFAFGIKYTALLNFIALFAYLGYYKAGRMAFIGFLSVAFGAVFLFRIDRFASINMDTISPFIITVLFIVSGLLILLFSFRKTFSKLKGIIIPDQLFLSTRITSVIYNLLPL